MIVDTSVLVDIERTGDTSRLRRWDAFGGFFVSVITLAELRVGIPRAKSERVRDRRRAMYDNLVLNVPAIAVSRDIAEVYADLVTALPDNLTLGAHDLMIGATALHIDVPVLTENVRDFRRMPSVKVLDYRS